jgi:histone acetyltransferase (RNA polymerase elongator complex component)
MGKNKELIIPVFISHQGCPHQCVFCNQNRITGSEIPPSPAEVIDYLALHLGTVKSGAVVAFYGGSFTGLSRELQTEYLGSVNPFIKTGQVSGIRVSTRPDYIDEDVLRLIKSLGVKTVELGVQSLDADVLRFSGRGHTYEDSLRAAALVKENGLELGIQLMCGLPGDNVPKFIVTVTRVIEAAPAFVRIYPTLVVNGAPLEALWRRGGYEPLSLVDAVSQCVSAVKMFRAAGIKVIRLGLQPSRELEEAVLAGPYHPSFGHLVESELAFERMSEALEGERSMKVEFLVNPSELSVYKGIKSYNIEKFRALRKEITIRSAEGVQSGGLVMVAA